LGDIEAALDTLNGAETKQGPADRRRSGQICLLHCVTAYPAPETDYKLRLLPNLNAIFGVPVGVSDHSLDPELVPALGTALGAAVIEKHFCLSRRDPGLDDPIALPPDLFTRMVRAVRRASGAGPGETLAAYSRDRGAPLVEAILGSGIKTLAPSEQANYERTNRSIHALRDIHPGEMIGPGDFAVLRTEKNLRPGLPPSWEAKIRGRKARNHIPAGEGIRFEDV
jgi:sialic acid synthase SpsE